MTASDPDLTPAPAEPEQLQEQPSEYQPPPSGGSSKLVRVLGLLVMIAGVIMIVAGVFTWIVVQTQLDDENITVSEDADRFAGDPVDGPLTAYAEADVIETHALEASGGLTYAELERDDPVRETVMTASFLRSSLFTSIVAFGVALMAAGLGVVLILIGIALLKISGQLAATVAANR